MDNKILCKESRIITNFLKTKLLLIYPDDFSGVHTHIKRMEEMKVEETKQKINNINRERILNENMPLHEFVFGKVRGLGENGVV